MNLFDIFQILMMFILGLLVLFAPTPKWLLRLERRIEKFFDRGIKPCAVVDIEEIARNMKKQ